MCVCVQVCVCAHTRMHAWLSHMTCIFVYNLFQAPSIKFSKYSHPKTDRTKYNKTTYYIIIKKVTSVSELTPNDLSFLMQQYYSQVHFLFQRRVDVLFPVQFTIKNQT